VPGLNVGVVGAGIVGLAHAWSAAERGHRVTIFERSAKARGASVRNFGMIWPIGQPAGIWHQTALVSRDRWLQLGQAAGIWVNPCGSIHLAHHAEEWDVLREFAAQAEQLGFNCRRLNADEVLDRTPAANPKNLLGGLFSTTELCVDPPKAVQQIATWLEQSFSVRLEFETDILALCHIGANQLIRLESSRGRHEAFDRVIVCGGDECQTLFPDAFAACGLKRCKLQMLKTGPQASHWRIGPHLASGLTLRHYRSFESCASLLKLRERIARESPELDRFGIHVMAAQNDAGEVILGDSHEYGEDIEPFDKTEIDELILRELRKIICLPDWTIAKRWHGYYLKSPGGAPIFEAEPLPGVHICTGTGGAGMSLAFGIAERAWRQWESA